MTHLTFLSSNAGKAKRNSIHLGKWFSILTLLFSLAIGNVWGADGDEAYVLTFSQLSSGTNYNSYTDAHSITVSSKTWSVYGNQSLGAYLGVGGKSLSSNTNRTITGSSTIDKIIKQVKVNYSGVVNGNSSALTVQSAKLEVSNNSSFNSIVETVTLSNLNITSSSSASYLSFTPSGSNWASGKYYRITITVTTTGSKNCHLDITSIQFIEGASGGGDPVDPTITFNNGTYTIGGAALNLSTLFSSNSSGAVTYTVYNANGTGAIIDGTSFTATTAGTCTVQASQAAATGYNAKTVTATITVQNCSDLLTINFASAAHGTFIVHQGTNNSGPAISSGTTLPNCGYVNLHVEFIPDDGYSGTCTCSPAASSYDGTNFTFSPSYAYNSVTLTVTFTKACTTPTISFPTATVTKYWGDGKFTLAPTISGNDLEAELSFSSNKTSCATVDANTGEVTLVNATGNGNPVTITATLAAAEEGGDCQNSVSASYTLWIYNHVTWLVDGEPTEAGSPTLFTTEGAGITGLPDAPDGDLVCSGKTFVGWTTSAYTGASAPDPLYTSVSDMSSIHVNDNVTYYAVFAEGSGGGGTPVTTTLYAEDFSGYSADGVPTGSITNSHTGTTVYDGKTLTYSVANGAGTTKIYAQNLAGGTSPELLVAKTNGYFRIAGIPNGGASTITVSYKQNAYRLVASVSGTGYSGTNTDNTAGTKSFTVTVGAGAASTFTLQFQATTTSNVRLDDIVVTCEIGGGGSYSDYSTTCGNCLAAPEPVVTARTDNAIISWPIVEGATGYNVTCSGGTVTVNGTTATITGLTSETEYTYTIQSVGPNPPYECFNTRNGSFTTPSATIDIVEWEEDAVVIYVDKEDGVNPLVIIDGEVEHGSITGAVATDLFFSKYFEGAGSMKLVAIFNGTGKEISLANYKIVDHHAAKNDDTGNYEYSGDTEYPLSSLGKISAGQEIIFFTRPQNTNSEQKLYECSNSFLTSKASENSASDNPRWIECNGSPFSKLIFNGDDALILRKSGTDIDVIGARTSSDGVVVDNLTNNCRNEKCWDGTIKNMDYGKTAGDYPNITLTGSETLLDYGVDLTNETISAYTARCILFRNKEVTSGADAVASNVTDFTSFTASEWYGRNVCVTQTRCGELGWTYSAGGKTYYDNSAATCGAYQYLGEFDYNNYYTEYDNISDDTYLDSYTKDAETGEYTIPIANLSDYSCLSLRFQLQDNGEVIAENAVQVPIIVSGTHNTNDAIFNEIVVDKGTGTVQYDKSIERCQTCNVVVLGNAVLTKATDGATHDVPRVRDLTIYPGGKLVVPNSTNYNVHSLALRRQEDDIPLADIKGTLNIGATNGVSLDLRIDPTNWHYVALPYNCDVNNVTFADGETATLGTDWLCAWYNGAYRAEHKDGGWTDITAGTTLKKGKGYIISLPGAGKVRKELRFPMANGVIADEKNNKSVGELYAYGGDKTDAQLTVNHKGWNMIGNPYMMYYATDITTPLAVGQLVDSADTYKRVGSARYLVRPLSNGWSGYEQIPISTHMPPFTAYFVQIGANNRTGGDNPATEKTITFNQSSAGQNSVRRRDAIAEEDNHPIWYGIELIAPNSEKDNTTLLISNDFTDEYDMMDDLVKLRGRYYNYSSVTTAPVLASRNSNEELAFNALPDESAAVTGVPLNYYAAQAGTYTFQTDNNFAIDEIQSAMLFDAVTNTWTDMLTGNYSFTTAKGDNTDRFTLFVRVERKSPEVATGTDNMLDGRLSLVTIGRTMILSGLNEQANIYVYDMSGKLITSDLVNGNSVWRTSAPAAGVYFVRVNSANGQQTMRAIVK